MIVTQIPDRFRRRCSNLVLRCTPRLHDMKSASAWPAKLAMLVTQRRESPVCQDRPQGRSAWKKQLPRESCFFRGLDWRGVSMLHRTAIPLVTQLAARCLAPGDAAVLHVKIDIFCHLSKFFLTPARGKGCPRREIGGDVSKGMEDVSEEDGGHAGGAVVRCAAERSGAAQPRLPKK